MRESRTYGSVRGALSNERPYRDRFARNDDVLDRHWISSPRQHESKKSLITRERRGEM